MTDNIPLSINYNCNPFDKQEVISLIREYIYNDIHYLNNNNKQILFDNVLNNINKSETIVDLFGNIYRIWEQIKPSPSDVMHLRENMWLPNRLSEISNIYTDTPNNYLDIGYGDAFLTNSLIKKWSLSKANSFGAELKVNNSRKCFTDVNISISSDNDYYFYLNSNSICFCTLFNVLHHALNISSLLKELKRIIKTDSYVLLKEHNVHTIFEGIFLSFVELFVRHLYFNKDFSDSGMILCYYNYDNLINLFSNYGFTIVDWYKPNEPISTFPIYILFKNNKGTSI